MMVAMRINKKIHLLNIFQFTIFPLFFFVMYLCLFLFTLSNYTRMLCCHSTCIRTLCTKRCFVKYIFSKKMSCVLAFVPVDVIHFVNNLSTVTGLRQHHAMTICVCLVLTSPALHPQTWFKIRFHNGSIHYTHTTHIPKSYFNSPT